MLKLRLFGGLALEVDGSPVPVPSGRLGTLLAWLALNPGMQPRSRVAARLWPEVLDESARRSLRTALLDLRRVLGPGAERYLRGTRDEVGLWPPEEVWVDAHAFEEAIAQGRPEDAIAVAQGELLPELGHDWVYDARDAQQRALAAAVEQLAAAAEAHGDLAAAIEHTHRLVAIEPLAEEHARALIRRLAAAGDRAAALAAYERHRERLRTELRMAPSPQTRELVERIRGAEDAPAAAAQPRAVGAEQAAVSTVLSAYMTRPLFGRDAEVERLVGAWREVTGGGGVRCVLLAGEPGIGKTRLLAELARVAHGEGATVLYGRCREDAPFPYAPFVEALRAHVAATSAEQVRLQIGPGVAELAKLVPQLADPGGAAEAPEPETEALRLFDAVTALIAGVAPVLLALDDLQWADRPTAQLLDHLTLSEPRAPILVIGTYRRTELPNEHPLRARLARMRREGVLDHLQLTGLGQAATGELVRASSEGTPPRALLHAVFERTGGNPYYVEEYIRELRATGAGLADMGVPDTVQELIGRRLARLNESSHAIVSAAAVVGTEFDLELLGLVKETTEDSLIDAVDEAAGAHVITEGPRPGQYAFVHALVRDTLYQRLSATRRARLHGRVGRAIEQRHADELEEHLPALARHHELAADLEPTVRYHRLAGDAAVRVHAAGKALDHYARALAAAEELGLGADDPPVYGILHSRAGVRQRAGDVAGALEDAEAAVAGARAAGDAQAEIEALNRCGFIRRVQDVEAAIGYHESALEVAERVGDARAQVETLARLSIAFSNHLRLDEAVRFGERALTLAETLGQDAAIAVALDAVKLAALQIGDLEVLDTATVRLLGLRRQARGAWELHWLDDWVLLERSFISIARAQWDEAMAKVEDALATNRRLRNRFAEPLFIDALAWVHRGAGHLERAIALGRDAVDLAHNLQTAEWEAWTCATLGWTMLEAGLAADAAEHLERGLIAAEPVASRTQRLRCTALLAWALWELGDRERALDLADRAEALIAETTAPLGRAFLFGAHAPLAVARVRVAAHQSERAAALVAPILAAARASGWIEVEREAQARLSEVTAARQ